jgi:hypothetical protein
MARKKKRKVQKRIRDITAFVSEIAGIVGLVITLIQCLIGG